MVTGTGRMTHVDDDCRCRRNKQLQDGDVTSKRARSEAVKQGLVKAIPETPRTNVASALSRGGGGEITQQY